jgi:hypothetical protein
MNAVYELAKGLQNSNEKSVAELAKAYIALVKSYQDLIYVNESLTNQLLEIDEHGLD